MANCTMIAPRHFCKVASTIPVCNPVTSLVKSERIQAYASGCTSRNLLETRDDVSTEYRSIKQTLSLGRDVNLTVV